MAPLLPERGPGVAEGACPAGDLATEAGVLAELPGALGSLCASAAGATAGSGAGFPLRSCLAARPGAAATAAPADHSTASMPATPAANASRTAPPKRCRMDSRGSSTRTMAKTAAAQTARAAALTAGQSRVSPARSDRSIAEPLWMAPCLNRAAARMSTNATWGSGTAR